MKPLRPDRSGTHRVVFDSNKKKILKIQDSCGICGNLVDKKMKYPHPLSPVIDHIIPVNKGGHPSDIENLQLAHMTCNRGKSDNLYSKNEPKEVVGNRNLPHSVDWIRHRRRKQK